MKNILAKGLHGKIGEMLGGYYASMTYATFTLKLGWGLMTLMRVPLGVTTSIMDAFFSLR